MSGCTVVAFGWTGETKATFSYEAADEEDEEYPDEEYFARFNPDENPDALEEWIERQVRHRVLRLLVWSLDSVDGPFGSLPSRGKTS